MHASAIVLAAVLANGCMRPGFTGTGTTDMISSCNQTEPCGSGRGDSELTMTIVLGTAVAGSIALAVHRYLIVDR